MKPPFRLLLCVLALSLSACTKAQPDLADAEPIRPDQDPWERVGATLSKKQAAAQ